MRRGGILLGLVALVLGAAPAAAPQPALQSMPNLAPGIPGLDSRLTQVAHEHRERGAAAALRQARESGLATEESRVRVVLETAPGKRAAARDAAEAAGAQIEATAGNLLQALVPIAGLASLPPQEGVAYVRPPLRAEPAAVSGEGVGSSGLSAWHSAGFRGAGVKVAVIDVGFAGLASAVGSGDVPASALTVDLCGGRIGGSDHGTAVAEIVHEAAPDAQLYLICVGTEVELAQALDYAKQSGIQIVNHSVGWFGGERGDGTGLPGSPADTVARARASGILWVNAAGNAARRHWGGAFADADADKLHDFAAGDETNNLTAPASQSLCVDLRWDDWPETDQDFNLYLAQAVDGLVLARSENRQVGGQIPYESLCWFNGGFAVDVVITIARAGGSTAPRLDLFTSVGTLEHRVAAGSVVDPATSASALSVGAVCWQNTSLEAFSSQGPTIDGRIKPDLVGPDNVSSSTYGTFSSCDTTLPTGFKGTSAAAPYVAGTAALVKQRFPSLSAADLQAHLERGARDLGTPGKDSGYGAGVLWLEPDSPRVVTGGPNPAGVKYAVATGTVDPNGFATTYWVEFGPSTGYGSQTPAVEAGSASGSKPVSSTIEGLQPNATYHYRLAARNVFGVTYGTDVTFTTRAPAAPLPSFGQTSPLVRSAIVQAIVNPNGEPTTVLVEYGSDLSYGRRTAAVDVGRGITAQTVAVTLTDLAPQSGYHYRVVATNAYGTTMSLDGSLVTLPPLPPVAATGGASSVGHSSATVGGSVDAKGEPTSFYVQYGSTTDYGGQTSPQSAGGALGAQGVSTSLEGLGAGTLYHYRLVAVNTFGTSFGADSTFTTAVAPAPAPSGAGAPSAGSGAAAPIPPVSPITPSPVAQRAGPALRRVGKTGTLRAVRVRTQARIETRIALGERARVTVSVVAPRGAPRVRLLAGSRIGRGLLRTRRAEMTVSLPARASAIRLRVSFAGLRPGKTYWIRIVAVDAAGGRSVLMVPFRR